MPFHNTPFSANSNLIMACHITGVHGVNRNTTLKNDDYELVRDWAESVAALGIQGVIFHNNFSETTCKIYENEYISFLKINYDPQFNPNVYRYFVYRDFLQQQAPFIKHIFATDISDVVVVKNPFTEPYFIENPTVIFCGDEPKVLDNDWMKAHSAQLRENISDYADYEKNFAQERLLNCGIIGGAMPIFKDFIEKLCAIHQAFNANKQTAYTGDMGAFNYLARTLFNQQIRHGSPINTQFKGYEVERKDCWFRHK